MGLKGRSEVVWLKTYWNINDVVERPDISVLELSVLAANTLDCLFIGNDDAGSSAVASMVAASLIHVASTYVVFHPRDSQS